MMSAAATSVVLSTYFSRVRDPQRRLTVRPDRPRMLAAWLPGMKRLGLRGRVFHNGLSKPFTERHRTDRIEFERVAVDHRLSCNDERFFVYRRWLCMHPEVESVFCTDLFDVQVRQDPHVLSATSSKLWVGVEPWRIAERAGMRARFRACYGEVPRFLRNRQILNAGIVGGCRRTMLHFLQLMTLEIERIRRAAGSRVNCNMAALNHVLYRDFGREGFCAPGRPLHSTFGAFEKDANDVYFVHR